MSHDHITKEPVTKEAATKEAATDQAVPELIGQQTDRHASGILVTLVDGDDRVIGAADKLVAHRAPGLLHRAFSVVLVNTAEEFILQRRAALKYHFPLRWSNACCGHPGPAIDTLAAAGKRLTEELGVACTLHSVGSFTYRAEDPVSGLVEHEIDHVFLGRHDGPFHPDPSEVAEVRVMRLSKLCEDLELHPDSYTPWLRQVINRVVALR